MDEGEFFESESMYAIMAWRFLIWYFFVCCFEWIDVYFRLWPFFESFDLFFRVAYPFGFFVIFSWLPYFAPKLFCFLRIRLLICFLAISPYIRLDIFIVLECPVLSVLFYAYHRYLFNLPSFAKTFWLISSCYIVIFSCGSFSFLSQHVPAFFLCFIIFACCNRFLICVSSRISDPGFEFMLVFF